MKDIYNDYRNEINKKRLILVIIFSIFVIGLLFGSIYVTILSNDQKKEILNTVHNYFTSFNKIDLSSKFLIFKNSLTKNLVFFISIWLLGISIIGIPIILIMIFFKSFITGFSIAGIFAKYKIPGILGIIIYLFPSNILSLALSMFLGAYSLNLSIKLVRHAFGKKTINFGLFMGKYLFLLFMCILCSIFCALFDAFLSPFLYKLFSNLLK